jgi:hypothetical protein
VIEMRAGHFVAASLATLLAGCIEADLPQLTTAGQAVATGKSDPAPGTRDLGPIEASNGSGCGAFGTKGTFEGAMIDLKNRAATLGANYVQIFTLTEPHHGGGCYVDAFVIRGLAFRVPNAANAPGGVAIAPPIAPPAAAAAAPAAPPAPDRGQSSAVVSTTADLRSAPSAVAPILVRLDAGAQLTVSNEIRNGWRYTSLPNGRIAFVQDAVLRISGPAPHTGS